MKRRDPGRYRAKVWYQTAVDTTDASGTPIQAWSDQFAFRALIRPARAYETARGSQQAGEVALDVLARYRPEFTNAGRLRVESTGQILQIDGVLDYEQRRIEVTMSCHESKAPTEAS